VKKTFILYGRLGPMWTAAANGAPLMPSLKLLLSPPLSALTTGRADVICDSFERRRRWRPRQLVFLKERRKKSTTTDWTSSGWCSSSSSLPSFLFSLSRCCVCAAACTLLFSVCLSVGASIQTFLLPSFPSVVVVVGGGGGGARTLFSMSATVDEEEVFCSAGDREKERKG
jgi:hypothetical protein